MIRHLKQAGVPEKDILAVYTSNIRSVIEYDYPMMNESNKNELEKMQRRVLKIIYGNQISYSTALERSGLDSLEQRRQELFKKFTLKTSTNPRYSEWFPIHTPYKYQMRKMKRYEEKNANTERLYKSPIYPTRRLLNEMNWGLPSFLYWLLMALNYCCFKLFLSCERVIIISWLLIGDSYVRRKKLRYWYAHDLATSVVAINFNN